MSVFNPIVQQAKRHTLCAVCGAPLFMMIQIDLWGNRTCERHAKEYPRCASCQRLICERLTGGGVAYSDGRVVCNLCRKTAIDTKEQAKPYVEAVAAWLYAQGFTFQNLALRIELVYRQELMARSEHRGVGEPQGMIFQQRSAARRKVEGVAILKGLPRLLLEGVTLHELGHAWLFLHGVDGLDSPIEEGFCNLLSYLYYSGLTTDEAQFHRRVLEQSPDPVYGDGFRAVQSAVQRYGLTTVVDHLRRQRRLP